MGLARRGAWMAWRGMGVAVPAVFVTFAFGSINGAFSRAIQHAPQAKIDSRCLPINNPLHARALKQCKNSSVCRVSLIMPCRSWVPAPHTGSLVPSFPFFPSTRYTCWQMRVQTMAGECGVPNEQSVYFDVCRPKASGTISSSRQIYRHRSVRWVMCDMSAFLIRSVLPDKMLLYTQPTAIAVDLIISSLTFVKRTPANGL